MKIVRVVATVAALAGLGAVLNVAVAQRTASPEAAPFLSVLATQFELPPLPTASEWCANPTRPVSAEAFAALCQGAEIF